MKLENGMKIEIHKTWYNKTRVQEDGITHIVEPQRYTAYQFGMAKNYFDIETKEEVVEQIIEDLQKTIQHLKKMKQQNRGNER